jgi:hypothetical protein
MGNNSESIVADEKFKEFEEFKDDNRRPNSTKRNGQIRPK